jgi:hypothetical protein
MDSDRLLLKSESIIDSDAWKAYLDKAQLTGVRVIRHGLSDDRAVGLNIETVGTLIHEMKPRRGLVGGLGNTLKNKLLRGEVDAQALLGLATSEDEDETRITLDDGAQSREVVLGNDSAPALVYPIDYDEPDRPDNELVYKEMEKVAPQLVKQLGGHLSGSWKDGEWSTEELSVTMEPVLEC